MDTTKQYLIELMGYKSQNNLTLPQVAQYANIGVNKLRRMLHSNDVTIPKRSRKLSPEHRRNISLSSKASKHNIRLKYDWQSEYELFINQHETDTTIGIKAFSKKRGYNSSYLRQYIRDNDIEQPRGIPIRTVNWNDKIANSLRLLGPTGGTNPRGSNGKLKGKPLSQEHKNNIRAGLILTHHGCSVADFEGTLSDRELYYFRVWKYTESQELEKLPNIEKRGNAGVSGAYQLDHIFPISSGFKQNIPIHIIGGIDNLQMLPWLENIRKSNTHANTHRILSLLKF